MTKKTYSRERVERAVGVARRVLEIEANAVRALVDTIDENFSRAVKMILDATGKVVVSGMGKSGIICQKIASTLASTGTAAFFLHPAEGVHGDLGVLMKNDVLLAVSNSGETEELVRIIPVVKRMGIKMIAMTGARRSTLARYADVVLYAGAEREACTLGLAPTASTTASLALGDALAVALLELKGFGPDDFAHLHPGGSLGRKLLPVDDLMHRDEDIPAVTTDTLMRDAVVEMTTKRLGFTGVFRDGRLAGVITDGDLRRAIERGGDLLDKRVEEVMTPNPKFVEEGTLAGEALRVMEENSITALFVLDRAGRVTGVVHLHDLLRAGVV